MLVSSTTRIRLYLRLGAAFGADLTDGLVDDALNLVRVGIGVARLDVLNGALKHAPADGVFDEFREVALFHAPSAQKGAQGEIGFLRDLDVPADSFFPFQHLYIQADKHLYTYCRPESAPGQGFPCPESRIPAFLAPDTRHLTPHFLNLQSSISDSPTPNP